MRSKFRPWCVRLVHSVWLATAALTVGCQGAAPSAEEAADLVLLDGRIATVDARRPQVEALAARGGRIVALGSTEAIRTLVGPQTRVISLDGAFAAPGFIESHGHFLPLGRSLAQLDFSEDRRWAEVVERVRVAAIEVEPGRWIFGRGWHQSKWESPPTTTVEGLPVHDALSAVTPDNPVLLTHASGHAVFANEVAMERAGIDASTPDPPGGEIVRDRGGEAIGVFRERAAGLIRPDRVGGSTEARLKEFVGLASRECLSKGVTSFQDAGSSLAEISVLKELAEEGSLDVRLWVMVRDSNENLAQALSDVRTVGSGDGFLTVRAIKKAIDGALGTHGAWLLEPYEDLAHNSGLATVSSEELAETARLAVRHDFQLCVHAIGDRGNRETLDLYESTYSRDPERDWRWRIEHAQHLHPNDVGRFAELGVIASMQGVHCTSDGPWVASRLGEERTRGGAYVWRSLLDSGAVVINGTDTPVERVDPLASYYASVSRKMANGERFYPEQRMTREEALRSYTLDAAYAAFEENEKGSFEVGKLADVVVLSKDLLSVAEEEIPSIEVLYTIVGGVVVYERDELLAEGG